MRQDQPFIIVVEDDLAFYNSICVKKKKDKSNGRGIINYFVKVKRLLVFQLFIYLFNDEGSKTLYPHIIVIRHLYH